jgi:two-component system response regulator MprA
MRLRETRSDGGMAGLEVLVIANDGVCSNAIADALLHAGWSVERAPAGAAAEERVARRSTGAVVVEAPPSALPEAVRRLRRLTTGPIVAVSRRAGPDARLAALAAGADDVLDPAAAEQELSVRLRVLVAGRAAGDGLLMAGDLQVDLGAREATRGGRRLALTPREFALVAYLAANANIALSRRAIVDNVWPDGGMMSDSSVSVLVFRLRRKLEAAGEPRLVHAVRGWGYVLRPREPGVNEL